MKGPAPYDAENRLMPTSSLEESAGPFPDKHLPSFSILTEAYEDQGIEFASPQALTTSTWKHEDSDTRTAPKTPITYDSVAVVGLGYVGWPLARLAGKKRYNVVGIEIDEKKLKLYENDEYVLDLSSDFSVIAQCAIIIICVPTPVGSGYEPDLSLVENACVDVAHFLREDQLVILESTVNPGICEKVVLPILEDVSGLKCGVDFHLAHCPERINPGDPQWNVENIPRVVGSIDETGLKMAIDFYNSILEAEVKPMSSIKEAEAVKVVENSFRDLNIAFVNELAMSFNRLGIDVVNVINGAATKPFSFMPHFPGCGIGGHCIPVDPYYLIAYAKENGFDHELLSMARRINNGMPGYLADILFRALEEAEIPLKSARVTLLGLSYKPDIEDCRESPSFHIMKKLNEKGVTVIPFDPYVMEKSGARTLDEALTGSDAVIVATAHKPFRQLTALDLLEKDIGIVIDGRNCLSKQSFIREGISYHGIGR